MKGEEKKRKNAEGACACFSAISRRPGSFPTTPLRVKSTTVGLATRRRDGHGGVSGKSPSVFLCLCMDLAWQDDEQNPEAAVEQPGSLAIAGSRGAPQAGTVENGAANEQTVQEMHPREPTNAGLVA